MSAELIGYEEKDASTQSELGLLLDFLLEGKPYILILATGGEENEEENTVDLGFSVLASGIGTANDVNSLLRDIGTNLPVE